MQAGSEQRECADVSRNSEEEVQSSRTPGDQYSCSPVQWAFMGLIVGIRWKLYRVIFIEIDPF